MTTFVEEPAPTSVMTRRDLARALTALRERARKTIRDVAREVTVSMQVQRSGDGVRVSGSIPVTVTDFEIEAPDLGFVQVEDAGTIEMLLVLARA